MVQSVRKEGPSGLKSFWVRQIMPLTAPQNDRYEELCGCVLITESLIHYARFQFPCHQGRSQWSEDKIGENAAVELDRRIAGAGGLVAAAPTISPRSQAQETGLLSSHRPKSS